MGRSSRATGAQREGARPAGEPRPWERRLRESDEAYQAFCCYRDMPKRSMAAVARELDKGEALMWRWSERHAWPQRVWALDLWRDRQAEETAHRQREELEGRRLQHADQLQRLAMAKLTGLVVRDPETGELGLDPAVSPRDAVQIYRLGVELQRETFGRGVDEPGAEGQPAAQGSGIRGLAKEELDELIAVAKRRAAEKQQEERDDSEEGADQQETDDGKQQGAGAGTE